MLLATSTTTAGDHNTINQTIGVLLGKHWEASLYQVTGGKLKTCERACFAQALDYPVKGNGGGEGGAGPVNTFSTACRISWSRLRPSIAFAGDG